MTLSGTKYMCVAGESWDYIALVVYGNEKYAADLMNANPLFTYTPVFTGGEVLDIPVIDVPNNGSKYMPDIAPWKSR